MKNLLTLKKYFVKYKTKLFWGMLFILISNAATVYLPILLKDSINALQKDATSEKLLQYALLIVGTSIVV